MAYCEVNGASFGDAFAIPDFVGLNICGSCIVGLEGDKVSNDGHTVCRLEEHFDVHPGLMVELGYGDNKPLLCDGITTATMTTTTTARW